MPDRLSSYSHDLAAHQLFWSEIDVNPFLLCSESTGHIYVLLNFCIAIWAHTQTKSCPFSHDNQKLCFLVPTLYGKLYFPYNVGICSSHMGNHLSNMLKSLNTILWSIILKTCFKEWRHLLFPKVRTIILLHCNISLQGMFDSMYGLGMRGLTMKAYDTDTDIMKDFWEGWQAFQLLEEWS